MNQNEAATAIKHCVSREKPQPIMVWGPPGSGKSSIIRDVADEMFGTSAPKIRKRSDTLLPKNHPAPTPHFIDLRLPLLDSIDLRGLPTLPKEAGGVTVWAQPSFLPREGKGILFLDELVQAMPIVQAAASQLILDRRIGDYVLPDGWAVVAAGNRETDRAATNKMPSHIANRFTHIEFQVDANVWIEWALNKGLHPMVIAFIGFKPDLLHAFKPNERVNPTPRTWEFLSNLIEDAPDEVLADLVEGTVGKGAATEFNGFIRVFREMPDYEQICLDPAKAIIPKNSAARYSVATMLAQRAEVKDMKAIMVYTRRMEKEFQMLTMRDMTARNVRLAETASYISWAAENKDALLNATKRTTV